MHSSGRAAWLVGLALVAAVSGCAKEGVSQGNPYRSEFQTALEEAQGDELREILADGEITDAELERSKQLELDCIAGKGLTGRFSASGLEVDHPAGSEPGKVDETVSECASTGYDHIYWLYQAVRDNPTNIDPRIAWLDCFKRLDLVPQDTTLEQFNNELNKTEPVWDRQDGNAAGCMDDPKGYEGGRPDLTPEEARVIEVPDAGTAE